MLDKKEKSAAYKWVMVTAFILLTFFIFACNFLALKAQTESSSSTTSPEISWTETQSPFFPTTWPPSSNTIWGRYTFAYGSNPALLMDGSYVTNPLSKTEWKAGIESTTQINKEKTQASVQGIIPLDEETQKILEDENQVSEYCLTLTELPDLSMPEAQKMLAHYGTWFKYNNAFVELVKSDHSEFINWVAQNSQ